VNAANGPEVIALLASNVADDEFAEDVFASRDAVTLEDAAWPAD